MQHFWLTHRPPYVLCAYTSDVGHTTSKQLATTLFPLWDVIPLQAGNSVLLSQKVLPVFLITPPEPNTDVCYVSIGCVYVSLVSINFGTFVLSIDKDICGKAV